MRQFAHIARWMTVGIVTVLLAALWLMLTIAAHAHPPTRMAADGCHTDRKAGVRHHHQPDSTVVAGLCGASGEGPSGPDLEARVVALEKAVKKLSTNSASTCQVTVAKLYGSATGFGGTRNVPVQYLREANAACLK